MHNPHVPVCIMCGGSGIDNLKYLCVLDQGQEKTIVSLPVTWKYMYILILHASFHGLLFSLCIILI